MHEAVFMEPQITGKILVLDDNEDVLIAAQMLFERYDFKVEVEKDPEKLIPTLKRKRFDVILLAMNYTRDASSGREGFDLMTQIFDYDPTSIVIPITAYGDVEMAVKAMKIGATDFIEKPWKNERMLATVSSAIRLGNSRQEADSLRSKQEQLSRDIDQSYTQFIGQSEAIQQVFKVIDKVAETDANVLIMGENGSGKEFVAREIHRRSHRRNEVFLSVDLGAISETLFDSELFGHVKGAFTDAKHDRKGRFEVASGGTLFLDEIGNLSVSLQQKLLTSLHSREITRVGSNNKIPIDVRLICATNMPLLEMIEEKTFRQDLFYRINTVEINIPALRERLDDLPLLLDHFISINVKKYKKKIRRVSSKALKRLQEYRWPGNIRELQHAVERAVIMSDGDILEPEDFFLSSSKASSGNSLDLSDYNLESVEKMIIERVLQMRHGNVSHAAKDLGITRTSLYRRMEKHEL
ncbi:MAG: sigma-54 dependent transcriptional regulator [Opitutales bacterium]|nr:sigma-54 dependent transcriptional regulator [Opitutales bacterium]